MRALGNAVTLTAVVLVAVAPRAWAQSPGSKIAFIDVQRVLVRSAAGVAAREQLEREKAGMQQKMDAKRKELEALRDELEKKGPLMRRMRGATSRMRSSATAATPRPG